METKLYVGNLNFRTTEQILAEAFAAAGFAPVSVKIITDRETGRSRGFAFVEMQDAQGAEAALATMNDRLVDGRPLKITEAKPRGSTGFGGAGGAGGGFRGGAHRGERPFEDRGQGRPATGLGERPAQRYHDRPGPRFDDHAGARGGDRPGGPPEHRPRFAADGARPPRSSYGGGFTHEGGRGPAPLGGYGPGQPGGLLPDMEVGREHRRDRSKRRDLSKQHAERQDYDDEDDDWG